MIENLSFKCINHEKGCIKILKGKDFDISKHEKGECEFRDMTIG